MGLRSLIKKSIVGIFRWAANDNKVRENDIAEPVPYPIGTKSTMGSHGINDRGNGMNFTVYNATGGKVIQISSYNPNTDRHHSSLYVITDKEDLGSELGQIITRESLSR